MKTVKAETPATRKRRRGARQSQAKSASIPPESRRSTAAALLKHAPGWAGDDLDTGAQQVVHRFFPGTERGICRGWRGKQQCRDQR